MPTHSAIALAAAAALTTGTALADQMEQGIQYVCDKKNSQLRITTEWRSGGGQEDPYADAQQHEDDALWNYDRLRVPLPIVKTCALGARKIVTVIAKGCTARQGGSTPSIRIYADPIMDSTKGTIARGRPFVHAELFGSACWHGPVVFSEIRVRVPQDPNDTGLVVEMK
jgi:hypothetical protein